MQPLNILCALAVMGWVLHLKRPACGQKLMNICLLAIVILGVFPLGPLMMVWLERQYPAPAELPAKIDGLILLGGAFESARSTSLRTISVNGQIDRALCFVDIAKKYPAARLVFSGGNGDILNPEANESVDAKKFFEISGLGARPMLYEDKSKNTYENVIYSKALVNPKPDETWVVMTSAYHMPRTMGIFQKAGWGILPYQCDYKTDANYISPFTHLPNVASNFSIMNVALKEYFGILVYALTGKSTFILPSSKVTSAP